MSREQRALLQAQSALLKIGSYYAKYAILGDVQPPHAIANALRDALGEHWMTLCAPAAPDELDDDEASHVYPNPLD